MESAFTVLGIWVVVAVVVALGWGAFVQAADRQVTRRPPRGVQGAVPKGTRARRTTDVGRSERPAA